MSNISFRVISIELKDSIIKELDPQNNFRLNLTQRPHHIRQEYIVNDSNGLRNVNHEWNIDNSKNQVERVTLTIRTVQNKNLVDNNENQNGDNNKNYSNNNNDYVEPKHSLIGYCNIDLNNLRKDGDNDFTAELLTRVNVKIVGYVHLQIDFWGNDKKLLEKEKKPKNKKKIIFSNHKRKEYSNLI